MNDGHKAVGPNDPPRSKAVLVVHGIGRQEPGETTRKLLNGLSRIPGTVIRDSGQPIPEARVGGVWLRFYEVYWADLLKGEATRNTFSFREFQGVSWFPWLNRWRRVYPAGRYSFLSTFAWTVVLPILTSFLVAPFMGARFLATMFDADYGARIQPRDEGGGFWARAKRQADRAAHERTVLEDALDEYAGDVFNYVDSAGGARYPEGRDVEVPEAVQDVYGHIIGRFRQRLKEAAESNGEIQIVAHSLGTVVTYHGLFGLEDDGTDAVEFESLGEARSKVSHLYTIGSPLEKIGFFWPRLAKPLVAADALGLEWDNFVSWFDPVAGHLRHFDSWGVVDNHSLLGGGFLTGHVVYEKSKPFLEAFVRGVDGGGVTLERSAREKLRDGLILLGETLAVPLVFGLLTVIGGAITLATLLLLPFLLSLPFRLDFTPPLNPVLYDRLSWGFAGLLVSGFLVSSWSWAQRVHRHAWAKRSGPER